MLRTLIIVAALALVFLIIKNRIGARRLHQKKPASAKTDDMVKCLQCQTYIPAKEAIISGTETFCCKQHRRDWDNRHNKPS